MEVFLLVVVAIIGMLTAAALFLRRTGATSSAGADLALIAERLSKLEAANDAARGQLHALDSRVAETSAASTQAIQADLALAREGLAALAAAATARREAEEQSARSLRRLEQVIAGTAAKGGAGENIVELVFSRLPAEWQVRDFRVANRVVEFGLRLPNGLILPIDSKWPATAALESLAGCEDPAEQARLRNEVHAAVMHKAREVTKYLDPDLTPPFGIAVVPDAVEELCPAAKAECLKLNVVLLGYGMFVPYLLLVFQTVLRSSRDIDAEKLAAHVEALGEALERLQDEVEGRLSRALAMLSNSRDDLRVHAGRVRAGLTALEARAEVASLDERPTAALVDAAK